MKSGTKEKPTVHDKLKVSKILSDNTMIFIIIHKFFRNINHQQENTAECNLKKNIFYIKINYHNLKFIS